MVKEDGNHKFPWGNIYLAPTYLENKRIWLRKAEQWKRALLRTPDPKDSRNRAKKK